MSKSQKIEKVQSMLSEAKQSLNSIKSSEEEEKVFYDRESYLSEFDRVFERFDLEVELEEDMDKDEIFSEWQEKVNMSASDLRKWSKNPCSREASKDPVAVIRRNLRLLEKNKDEWTDEDYSDAERTISFISRMNSEEMRPDSPREGAHGCPSEWAVSLLNWAFNPFDSVPTPSSEVKEDLDPVEEVTLSEFELGSVDYDFNPVPDQVLYGDRDLALERAESLGLDGVHEHEFGPDNVTMYMPGSSHGDWVEAVNHPRQSVENSELEFKYSEGDKVKWDDGAAKGVVRDRTDDSCYDAAIDGDVKVCGESDSPAYLIEIYKEGELTGTMVAHKQDTLSEADFELSDSRKASKVFHADQERMESGEDDEGVRVDPVSIHKVEGGRNVEVSEDVEKVLDELWNEEDDE